MVTMLMGPRSVRCYGHYADLAMCVAMVTMLMGPRSVLWLLWDLGQWSLMGPRSVRCYGDGTMLIWDRGLCVAMVTMLMGPRSVRCYGHYADGTEVC